MKQSTATSGKFIPIAIGNEPVDENIRELTHPIDFSTDIVDPLQKLLRRIAQIELYEANKPIKNCVSVDNDILKGLGKYLKNIKTNIHAHCNATTCSKVSLVYFTSTLALCIPEEPTRPDGKTFR